MSDSLRDTLYETMLETQAAIKDIDHGLVSVAVPRSYVKEENGLLYVPDMELERTGNLKHLGWSIDDPSFTGNFVDYIRQMGEPDYAFVFTDLGDLVANGAELQVLRSEARKLLGISYGASSEDYGIFGTKAGTANKNVISYTRKHPSTVGFKSGMVRDSGATDIYAREMQAGRVIQSTFPEEVEFSYNALRHEHPETLEPRSEPMPVTELAPAYAAA